MLNRIFKRKRDARLFVKTFLISLAILVPISGIVVFSTYSVNTIQAPTVPNIPATSTNTPTINPINLQGLPFLNIGEALIDYRLNETLPVFLTQYEERTPMFFTFLIFGLTEGLNANTIMVAAYDANSKQGYIISIPRDSRVDFQRNNRKIVAAYPVGRLNGGGHEGGVARLKYEVATLIGFIPDFYISVDYEAFVRMVDAIGGVEIYVPFHMRYDDPCQALHIDITEGLQTLDGKNALHFARYRRGNDRRQDITDYQRIEHQQQVLTAVARKLITPTSILRIPEFVNIFNDYVDSNLTTGELIWFANQARSVGGVDGLNLYTLPMSGTSGAPAWYELPNEPEIVELVNRTVNPLMRDLTSQDLRIVH